VQDEWYHGWYADVRRDEKEYAIQFEQDGQWDPHRQLKTPDRNDTHEEAKSDRSGSHTIGISWPHEFRSQQFLQATFEKEFSRPIPKQSERHKPGIQYAYPREVQEWLEV